MIPSSPDSLLRSPESEISEGLSRSRLRQWNTLSVFTEQTPHVPRDRLRQGRHQRGHGTSRFVTTGRTENASRALHCSAAFRLPVPTRGAVTLAKSTPRESNRHPEVQGARLHRCRPTGGAAVRVRFVPQFGLSAGSACVEHGTRRRKLPGVSKKPTFGGVDMTMMIPFRHADAPSQAPMWRCR
ncbi:UNVERIFIED_CONTAM: hypothetical protein GTU68_041828 [Idotea baltica]|nr:hypothetical protein [Idotea baltica]